MGYIESTLLPGETVVRRARLHRIIFLKPVLVILLGGGVAYYEPISGTIIGTVGLLMAIPPLITTATSEFAVTSKRVVIKVGLIRRRTLELLLRQIEAISVDQSLLGRMMNYGTITVMGTGGVREAFYNIVHPLEFRRAVHGQSIEQDTHEATP